MTIKTTAAYRNASASTLHPEYLLRMEEWERVRDCMKGEVAIKKQRTKYLPQPAGMDNEYKDAYEAYLERAHFPLICPYALAGVLGVIITKLPEFNLPQELEYLKEKATKDGRSIDQLFLDIIIDIFQTGRVPLVVDVKKQTNEFTIVQYKAEDLINWKSSIVDDDRSITLGVIKQTVYKNPEDVFSHETKDVYRALILENGKYTVRTYDDSNVEGTSETKVVPSLYGETLNELPIVIAGSISNSPDIQPIPLIPVANCAVQIYRKEADLANSEFLSCNPTLVITGCDDDDKIPNVVGSSVVIVLPDSQSQAFYTRTDTAALQHVKTHINDLYEEAIRHGVAILDSRKGVEAAEALRIRQATQSSSIYSIYLSALSAIRACLEVMCRWRGFDSSKIKLDAPSSLTFGIPDSNVISQLLAGFAKNVIPLEIVHKYMVSSGLIDQKVSLEDYRKLLEENKEFRKKMGMDEAAEMAKKLQENAQNGGVGGDNTDNNQQKQQESTKN